MDVALIIIALVVGIVGLLGVVVPVLPGTIFSYIGLVCVYIISDGYVSVNQLILWGVVAVVAILLDYILPGYFSKLFGGSKAGITGATVGTFLGIFFGVPGIVFGPFVGAVAGEMLGAKIPFEKALKVGFGSMLSFVVGTGVKLVAAVYMLYYIVKAAIDIAFY
jgi:uncharacterized protein YqgC (DUF456 family)